MDPIDASWLAEQCGMLPRVARGVLLRAERGASGNTAARWPQGGPPALDLEAFGIAALTQGAPLTEERPGRRGPAGLALWIALPFQHSAERRAVVAVEIQDAKAEEAVIWLERLRAGAGWLGALERREAARARLAAVLAVLAPALEQDRPHEAATAVATELAGRLDCERVAIGLVDGPGIRIEGLSNSAEFDPRSAVLRDLAAAMDEACDQDATIVYPAPQVASPRLDGAHEQLVLRHGAGSAWTVPLTRAGRILGAVTFERRSAQGADDRSVRFTEEVAALLGPAFALHRASQAGPVARIRTWLRDRIAPALGLQRFESRAATAVLGAVLLVFAIAPTSHRITADAALEGRIQRAIVSGIDGYLLQVNVRPGDVVTRGQILARLDDRDLLVERRKWAGRREELSREHREALARHDRAEANVASARMAQAQAEFELLDGQLARTEVMAPFDGVVVRGDLSQSLGSPFAKGDVLFEVAPLEGYRIVLDVDERDVAYVSPGQHGRLVLAALPDEAMPLVVERVTPVAIATEGRNVFRVEAYPETPSPSLRPGMKGVAKIDTGRRSRFWIWTHDLIDWVRLRAWSWWP
jgi:biotin carboxyl carrier protein